MDKRKLYDKIIWDCARIIKRSIEEISRNSINEDYIELIGSDNLNQNNDLVIEEIITSLRNKSNGINTSWDIDPWQFVKEYEKYDLTFKPYNTEELRNLIKISIDNLGPECDLNWIDVSSMTDMSSVFYESSFTGDISKWDVSKVSNMENMFAYSVFNGDISAWDVSSVTDMSFMFRKSKFDNIISEWNVSSVETMEGMFEMSVFNRDISKWVVSKVKNMGFMFCDSKFNGDISGWDVTSVLDMT
jgi:surface protein